MSRQRGLEGGGKGLGLGSKIMAKEHDIERREKWEIG